MKEVDAALAGEVSGHVFFADRYFGYDDAIYGALRLIEIVANDDKPLSVLLSDIPQTYVTPEMRFECDDEKKFMIVEEVKSALEKDYQLVDIDGVRVVFDDGWGLVRASNTQPALVMRFEANTKERLEEIRTLVETTVKEIKERS